MDIYERFREQGTLSEPKGIPDPTYALPSTVNWMRALAILVNHHGIEHGFANNFYDLVGRDSFGKRAMSEHVINTIFEQLIIALHQCSALRALKGITRRSDVARIGVVSWYYGIYSAASAMIAAQVGSLQKDHAGTANTWDSQILAKKSILISPPFDSRITTLVKKHADIELENLLITKPFHVRHKPISADDAYGACHEYLSGTVNNWARWNAEVNIKSSKEFQKLGLSTFHSNLAKEFRDERLKNKTVCFLHQASRYRGKANYREALFLAYGSETEITLTTYIDDLSTVVDAFVCFAGIFCSRRLGKDIWKGFVDDLERKRSFTLSPYEIWGRP